MDPRQKIYDEPTSIVNRNQLNSRKSLMSTYHHHPQTENGYAKAYIEKYDRPDFYSGYAANATTINSNHDQFDNQQFNNHSQQSVANPPPHHVTSFGTQQSPSSTVTISVSPQLRSSKSLGNLNNSNNNHHKLTNSSNSRRSRSPPPLHTTNGYHHQYHRNSSSSIDHNHHLDDELSTKLLSDQEMNQIETFFKGNKSYVVVCQCLANLYFTNTDLYNGGRESKPRVHEWTLSRTGVPVLIFDKGETKSRDKRQLQILLAERGSGFVLWRDIIDNLSAYKAEHPSFHTLYLSSDHRKMAGLSFDHEHAAEQFLKEIESITSDPLNIALNAPKKSAAARKIRSLKKQLSFGSGTKPSREKPKLPRKCDISSPCLFQHVSSVDLADQNRLYSLSSLVLRDDSTTSADSPVSTTPDPESTSTSTTPAPMSHAQNGVVVNAIPHSNHNQMYHSHYRQNSTSQLAHHNSHTTNSAVTRRRSLSTSGGSSASSSSSPLFHQQHHHVTSPGSVSSSAAPSSILSHDL